MKHQLRLLRCVGCSWTRTGIQPGGSGCDWPAIRVITCMFLVGVLNTGCQINSMSSSQHALLISDKVGVYITGDVKLEGHTQIRRELSKQSVYEAAGGWAGFSEYGLEPRSIGITRIENGVTNKWEVGFDQMSRGKWKDFLFQENDYIVVHILY